MDFEFTEEERSVSELARKILEDFVTNERLKSLEADGDPFANDAWKALAEANLLGVAIPEAHGGIDLGFSALCLLCEEIGRTVAPLPVYASLTLAALPLAAYGSEAEKAEWLPRIASGEAILTAALSELDSSDPNRPTTHAERTSEGYRLTGEKTLVPAGLQAARILVSASTDDGETGAGLFWVAPGASGVRLEAQKSTDGQAYAYLALEGVEVSDADILGSVGDGALRWLLERATIARCAMQLGVTERALEMTAEYGRERVQFDVAIGSFQAFHQRVADAYIQVEGIRLTTWEAVWMLDRGLDARDMVNVAKFAASDGAAHSAFACQHLHGGVGIDVDYPLHRYFRWSTQIEHELGSAKIQLERLGERIASGEIAAF
ncbi:MAG: acyl-CoA/acyl-ACP dehydrogenase [bacterium]|nr:acyl-CoA dehydrogenase [Deltaproteobacteria bacterium]MCP4907682.1 acyl-CoA/acyl-ACP dehydrogenase [bacterium]